MTRFDALYGVTDPTVQFRDTFTAQFDVAGLLGEASLGCGIGGAQPNVLWDLVLTISERYTSVGGPSDVSGPQNTNMLINKGGNDPANRLGEMKARVLVLDHVYLEHFTPSIPVGSFINP